MFDNKGSFTKKLRFLQNVDDLISNYQKLTTKTVDVCQAGVKSIEGIDSLEGDQIELESEMNSYRVQHQQLVRSSSGLSDQAMSEVADTIVEKLSLLQEAADRTEQQCVELKSLLDKAQRASAKYQESHQLLLPWLEKMENRLESFDQSFESDQDGITPFDQLNSASEEIAERALLAEKLLASGEKLGALGADELLTEAEEANERYQKCRNLCRDMRRSAQKAMANHAQALERLAAFERAITRIEERLQAASAEPIEAVTDKIRQAKQENATHTREYQRLGPMHEQLIGDVKSATVKSRLEALQKRWNTIGATLESRETQLNNWEEKIKKFWSAETQSSSTLDLLDDELSDIRPTRQNMKKIGALPTRINQLEMDILDLKSQASSLSDEKLETKEAVKSVKNLETQLSRLKSMFDAKNDEIMRIVREYEAQTELKKQAAKWTRDKVAHLETMEKPTTAKDCRDKIQAINGIRVQSAQHLAHLTPQDWAQLDQLMQDEREKAEATLVELGQSEAVIDELSDWTAHCGKVLNDIQVNDDDRTSLAKIELLQDELEKKKHAASKLNKKTKQFPNQQKRLAKAIDNLKKVDAIAEAKYAALSAHLANAAKADAERKKIEAWAAGLTHQLMNDGPYDGQLEEAREQVKQFQKVMDDYETQRTNHFNALTPERWNEMARELDRRKDKLDELLSEIESYWTSVIDLEQAVKNFESLTKNQDPCSVLEDTIHQQINENLTLEKKLRLKTAQLSNIEDLSGVLRVKVKREDAIQVKNTAVGLHSRWEKLLQRVSRRNNQLDENKRKSVIYSEKSSNFRDFVDETTQLIRSQRGKGDSRNSV